MPGNNVGVDEHGGGSGASLMCESILSLPLQQLGGGGGDGNDDPAAHVVSYAPQQPAWHCTFSPDGSYLAVAYGAPDPCVRLWKNIKNPSSSSVSSSSWQLCPRSLTGIQTRTIRTVAFAPVSRPLTLAAASFDGTVAVWTQQTQSSPLQVDDDWDCLAQLEGHDNEVKSVAWNSTASLLASCGRDKTVWIWECFIPGTVGGSHDGDFDCVAVLHGHEADVKCVQFAASHGLFGDGDDICLSGSYDNTVRVWAEDAGDWYCAAVLDDLHASTIWTIAVAPSGTRFVSGSADGSLAICKCYSAEELRQQQQAPAATASKSMQHSTAITKSAWKCVGKLPDAHADGSIVYTVDYAPAKVGHGRIASGGADHRVQVYREVMDTNNKYNPDQPRFVVDACASTRGGDVNCVSWHPWDGSVLASAGDDGNVRIWRYKTA